MTQVPRLSLRTIFLLFFCAAVGLATYAHPLGALEPAAGAMVAIGLIQQVRQLLAWHPSAAESTGEIVFARRYAIVWRVVLAALIISWLIVGFLRQSGLLRLPDHDSVWFHLEYQSILPICLVVVVCNGIARWRSSANIPARIRGQSAMLWIVGILVGIITLLDATLIEYLTHKAIAGIEAAHPLWLQRPDVYPDLGDERYRPLWIAFAAALSWLSAGGVIVWSANKQLSMATSDARYLLAASLLIPPAFFSYWFYTSEFYRLSPEMAGAGLAAIWIDWWIGALIVLVLATVGAHRFSQSRERWVGVTSDLAHDLECTAIHESSAGVALISITAIYSVSSYVASNASAWSIFGRRPPVWAYATILCSPSALLAIALCIAALQLCRIRWRCRFQKVPWMMPGLVKSYYLRNWAALVVLTIVGVPTLNAFAFLICLGPWNVLRLFGY